SQPGSLLVGFAVDRLQQLLAELDQLRLRLLALRQTARRLAAVLRLAVDVLQKRRQLLAKLLVVVRAAQPTRVAEINKLDPAHRAVVVHRPGLFALLRRGRRSPLRAGRLLLGLVQILVRTFLAQMMFFKLLFAEDFRDVQGSGLRTLVALHRRPPYPF